MSNFTSDEIKRFRNYSVFFLVVLFAIIGLQVNDKRSQDRFEKAQHAETQRYVQLKYEQDIDNWHRFVRGCNRSKQDRASSARLYNVFATYYKNVLRAKSVKQDVKDAAKDIRAALLSAANSLLSRAGKNLDCNVQYPKPKAPAGVQELE